MSEATPGSGRYPPKSHVRRAAPAAVTLVQGVSRTITIAGFPLSVWLFALRIWAAMMVALYAAFWLQLESASSAAVTVGILALQTRGHAYQKAAYRVLATIIGVVASIVIAGLFAQSRSFLVLGFAGWLGLCVYAEVTFDPPCRGLCGSHKRASMLVANANRPLSASSLPRSRCT
jgi:Fusaric acid resistance protein family